MKLQLANVTLRPLRTCDAERLAWLANNPKISVNLRDGFPNPYSVNDAISFLSKFSHQNPVTFFGIDYNDEYVGNISIIPADDVYRKSAEIGYFIGEEYWNKGIVTQAVKLICDYGFGQLDLARIYAGIFEYNQASQRVLEKCGFEREGIFKKSVFKQGKLWNEYRYAILKPGL